MVSLFRRSLVAKIALSISLISILGFAVVSTFIASKAKESLVIQSDKNHKELTEASVKDVEALNKYTKTSAEQLYYLLEHILFEETNNSKITIDDTKLIATGKYSAPSAYIGNELINNNFKYVDKFNKITKGSVATIFIRSGDDFLRVSTSLKKSDGSRADGTILGKDHPGYQMLMDGQDYIGKAQLFGTNYITKYKPIVKNGKTVAILFIGLNIEPQIDELRNKIKMACAQKDSWVYIYNISTRNFGEAILEPNMKDRHGFHQTSLDGEKIFERMAQLRDGFLQYKRNVPNRGVVEYIGYFATFDEWNWLICVEIEKSLLSQSAKDMQKVMFFYGVALALLIILLVTAQIGYSTRGIVKLTREIQKASSGKEFVNLSVTGKDEIAILATSFNELQNKLKAHQIELEQKIVEAVDEIRKKDAQLAKQSKSAALTEMMGNVAHQWRQPLSAIFMNVQYIQLLYDTDSLSHDELAKIVDECRNLVTYMSQTIEDFKNLIRSDKTNSKFVVAEQVRAAINISQKTLESNGINIELDVVDDIECIGYANEFTQVIINMMSNSKDAFIANNIKDRKITIQIKKQDKTLLISHTDNAGGIPDDVIEHVFEPYFTTKHKSQGTGLGLYMSKMLIEDGMSGSIAVVNVNGGAKFVIEIDLEANLSDRVVGDFCTLEDGSDLLNKQLDGII